VSQIREAKVHTVGFPSVAEEKQNNRGLSAATDKRDESLVLNAFRSVLPARGAIYCSGPITSGLLALKWADLRGNRNFDVDLFSEREKKEFQDEVVDVNKQNLSQAAERIRAETHEVVINPAAMPHCNGWPQSQWRELWRTVIERYVFAMIVLEDWAYSKGAAYEVSIALRKGLKVATIDHKTLDAISAQQAIAAAVSALKVRGIDVTFYEKILAEICGLRK
jgi:hypothetical protein